LSSNETRRREKYSAVENHSERSQRSKSRAIGRGFCNVMAVQFAFQFAGISETRPW
jgi:hypothetical protein